MNESKRIIDKVLSKQYKNLIIFLQQESTDLYV